MPTTEMTPREERSVKNVRHVILRDIGRLIVHQGDTDSLLVESESEMLPNITTVMNGDTLELGMSRSWSERIANSFTLRHVNYHLTVKNFESVDLQGISNLEMVGITGKSLEIATRGHISVKLENINVRKLIGKFHWATNTLVSGEAVQQEILLTGSSKYRASNLLSQQGAFVISDTATADVNVEKKIMVETSGEGFMQYKGNPKVITKGKGGGVQHQTW
jgi:hypothetical protein